MKAPHGPEIFVNWVRLWPVVATHLAAGPTAEAVATGRQMLDPSQQRFEDELKRRVAELTVLQPDDRMVLICAQLRADCARAGHALGDKLHGGDRWIAAATVRLGLPLVSHDGVFKGAPGLQLITATEL